MAKKKPTSKTRAKKTTRKKKLTPAQQRLEDSLRRSRGELDEEDEDLDDDDELELVLEKEPDLEDEDLVAEGAAAAPKIKLPSIETLATAFWPFFYEKQRQLEYQTAPMEQACKLAWDMAVKAACAIHGRAFPA